MEPEVLGQVANPPARGRIVDRPIEQGSAPGGRPRQPEQDLDRGRLAGSVRTEEAEDLTRLDGQGEVVEGNPTAELLAEPGRLDRQAYRSDSATRCTSALW